MKKIVITGGAGFIGSHVTEQICESFPDAQVVVLDKMTYAADIGYLLPLVQAKRIELSVGDVCDYKFCVEVLAGCDLLIHAAAESHVDRSFHSSMLFTRTNAVGTHTILEAARTTHVPRIIHVSTDEVYGEVMTSARDETGAMNPTNPYSASKAAAEMIVRGYLHSFKLPIIVVRANNVCGIRQFPEKLIPRSIMALIAGEKIPLHGTGKNTRHYLCATDFALALALLAKKGKDNETYNIGSPDEFTNRAVAEMICASFGYDPKDHITYVADRPFNDRRYLISWDKIAQLGWKPQRTLPLELPAIVAWYRKNADNMLSRMSLAKTHDQD
ncbi:MAG: GDP-mannose 4,6-dehydratase [Alphaproteobacteria bacterium]|nr:GDP-mannose 4,6-dehydratase [Alphaproteobacteria bacterium]MBL7099804.1 GDP-mannose 4,6-dehydratase [Alphaproteobacteria bacterium]